MIHTEEQAPGKTKEKNIIRRDYINGRHVYIKQYKPAGWMQTDKIVRAQIKMEVDILKKLYEHAGKESNMGIQKVVDSNIEQATVITEEVRGNTLEYVLINSNIPQKYGDCIRALNFAGKWLRLMQQLDISGSENTNNPSDPDNLTEYCDLRIKTIISYNYLNWQTREKIINWLKKQLSMISQEHLKKVWCHEDYSPSNIMWDGETLTPIDFSMCRPDIALVDLTYLIHQLEMMRVKFPWKIWPVSEWKKACLNGYGMKYAEELPIYKALMVRHLLCRLQTFVRDNPKKIIQQLHNTLIKAQVMFKLKKSIMM